MLPTRTTVLLLSAGLLLWLGGMAAQAMETVLPAWLAPTVVLGSHRLVLGYDGCVALLFLSDATYAWRATRVVGLTVRRERPARLSLGVDNEVVIVLEGRPGSWHPDLLDRLLSRLLLRGLVYEFMVLMSRLGVRLHLIVRDDVPPGFRANPIQLESVLPGLGQSRLAYRLLPTQRGDFAFGDVYLRCRGPLGLALVDRRLPAGEAVQVYPNLLEVRRYEAIMRTTLVRAGGYRPKRMPGGGREFSHFRDYTPDDDYRQVSWKATVRRNKPITAVFEAEHSQDVIFCLDVGRMMAARVGALTKLDHAINAVLMLTHVSQTFQDNVGLLVFSHTVHLYLPPAKGRGQNSRFLQALYSVKPEYCYVNYREAFNTLIARHPKRALTMVFTDLLDATASKEYLEAAALLRRFHLPLTLAVADVPLQKLAAQQPRDAEHLYNVLTARDLLAGRSEMLRSLERQGALVLDTAPEKLTIDAVNRYLALKTGMRM